MIQAKRKVLAETAANELFYAAERCRTLVQGSKGPTLAEIRRMERATREIRKVKPD